MVCKLIALKLRSLERDGREPSALMSLVLLAGAEPFYTVKILSSKKDSPLYLNTLG